MNSKNYEVLIEIISDYGRIILTKILNKRQNKSDGEPDFRIQLSTTAPTIITNFVGGNVAYFMYFT